MSNRELTRIGWGPVGRIENFKQLGDAERLSTSVCNVSLMARQATALFH